MVRCYVSDRVKGRVRRALGDSVLHRKLLFDRGGGDRQIMQRVRFAKRVVGENRISLRDGHISGASELAISILGDSWQMPESLVLSERVPCLQSPHGSNGCLINLLVCRLAFYGVFGRYRTKETRPFG